MRMHHITSGRAREGGDSEARGKRFPKNLSLPRVDVVLAPCGGRFWLVMVANGASTCW